MAARRRVAHTGGMTDHSPFPPPTVPTAAPKPESETTKSDRLPHPVALFVVAGALGALAALVIGGGVGFLSAAMASADCSPSDGWCGLGALVVGVFMGLIAGGIAYIAAGVMTIFRFRRDGRRAGHVLAHLAAPFALVLIGAILAGISP